MNDDIGKLLQDISSSISGIDFHLSGRRDFNDYKSNPTVKRAVETELEIIGEAVGRILKIKKDFPLTSAHLIIGLRNRVIHSYDAVDDNLIWRVVCKDLPVLKSEVDKFLS